MLSLFRKKKTPGLPIENVAQEKLANNIVSACFRFQRKWADFMQRHTERLSRKGKLNILCLFCVAAASLSIYFIASSVTHRKASSFTVIHLKKPPYAVNAGDEKTKALVIISEDEYKKIHRFRNYMDSLARSPSGKQLYESILSQRPGLMDSIMIIEELYKAKK